MPKVKTISKRDRTLRKGNKKAQPPAEGTRVTSQDLQAQQIKLKAQNAGVSEITRRKQVEEDLRNSENRLQQSWQLIGAHERKGDDCPWTLRILFFPN